MCTPPFSGNVTYQIMPSASSVSSASQLARISRQIGGWCRRGDSEVMEAPRLVATGALGHKRALPPGAQKCRGREELWRKVAAAGALTARPQAVALAHHETP